MTILHQKELETVYEDNQWIVHIPHTLRAYLMVADEFKTSYLAAPSKEYCFNYYNKRGPIYIVIYKPYGIKFLFHLQRDRYVNYLGERVLIKKIGLSKELIKFFKKINPLFMISQKFDEIIPTQNGFYTVRYEEKYNFLKPSGRLVSPHQWFDEVTPFTEDYATVRLGKKSFLLNKKGKLISSDSTKTTK